MIYCISETNWQNRLDAKIELDGSDVLLHSRGGATGGRPPRNIDYEKALRVIIRRLRSEGQVIESVLLDSSVARKQPEEERILASASELVGVPDEDVLTLVRQRAKRWGQRPEARGGNSTKALRIRMKHRDKSSLRSTLALMNWEGSDMRKDDLVPLSVEEQRQVSHENVRNAVARLLEGKDAMNFAGSRDYDLLTAEGVRLAPKKVFGIALEEALGIEVFPAHFKAGWNQPCFQIIQEAGYEIVEKGALPSTREELEDALADVPPDEADRSTLEGNIRLVTHLRRERARGLSKRKKAAFIRENGRLYCERCKMDPVAVYGENGDACIEVHHALVHVKDMLEGHETRLEDLQCLCANCHRIIHRETSLQS